MSQNLSPTLNFSQPCALFFSATQTSNLCNIPCLNGKCATSPTDIGDSHLILQLTSAQDPGEALDMNAASFFDYSVRWVIGRVLCHSARESPSTFVPTTHRSQYGCIRRCAFPAWPSDPTSWSGTTEQSRTRTHVLPMWMILRWVHRCRPPCCVELIAHNQPVGSF